MVKLYSELFTFAFRRIDNIFFEGLYRYRNNDARLMADIQHLGHNISAVFESDHFWPRP